VTEKAQIRSVNPFIELLEQTQEHHLVDFHVDFYKYYYKFNSYKSLDKPIFWLIIKPPFLDHNLSTIALFQTQNLVNKFLFAEYRIQSYVVWG
jgi:hypothetical protein